MRRNIPFLALLLCLLCISLTARAEEIYNVTFSDDNKPDNFNLQANPYEFTIADVTWTLSQTPVKGETTRLEWASVGIHIGTNDYPITAAEVTTSSLATSHINSVVVNAGTNSDVEDTYLTVTLGGTPLLCDGQQAVQIGHNKADYTFTTDTPLTGDLTIAYTSDKTVVYLSKIVISTDDGPVTPDVAYSASFIGYDTDDLTASVTLPTLDYPADYTGDITYSSSDTNIATIDSSGTVTITGNIGTTTITATLLGDDSYTTATAAYTLVIKAPHTFDFEVHDYGITNDYSSATTNIYSRDYTVATITGSYRRTNSGSPTLELTAGSTITLAADEAVATAITITGSNLGALTTSTGSCTTDGTTLTWTGNSDEVTFTATSTTYLVTIDITAEDYSQGTGQLTISTAEGYDTFFTDSAYILPQGLTATTITGIDDSGLVMRWEYSAGAIIPANTPLLIQGTTGTYEYTIIDSSEAAPSGNLLYGSTTSTTTSVNGSTTDYRFYALSYDDNGSLGFYWSAADGAPFTSADNKAWLAIPVSDNPQEGYVLVDNGSGSEEEGESGDGNDDDDDSGTGTGSGSDEGSGSGSGSDEGSGSGSGSDEGSGSGSDTGEGSGSGDDEGSGSGDGDGSGSGSDEGSGSGSGSGDDSGAGEDGITEISSSSDDSSTIYTLQGTILNTQPRTGLFIRNGKKYLAK